MDGHVGIVGSRRRNTLQDQRIVFWLMAWLKSEDDRTVIVSGGCGEGADSYAEEAADAMGLATLIFPIDREGIDWTTGRAAYGEFTRRAHARNLKIVESSEEIYALVAPDRTGGTENTIQHALKLKKPVYLITEDGSVYLSPDGKIPSCAPVRRLLDSNSIG